MKVRTILLALAFFLAGTLACFASDDANLGSWKLNETKSNIPDGVGKTTSIVFTAEGEQFKYVSDGIDKTGKPVRHEWTGKFDGKDYPLVGDPGADARAIKMVDAHHYTGTNKKDGKPTSTATIVISADGKTRTVTIQSTDASGKKVSATFVYDKQ
jgi:hypothetical protein